MSGVPLPQYPITETFGKNATNPADITLPIPVASQQSILVGAASFADAFPPSTRTPPENGGSYVFGQDVNGILFMLSQYGCLYQGGQKVVFDAAVATAIGGYAIGAVLAAKSGDPDAGGDSIVTEGGDSLITEGGDDIVTDGLTPAAPTPGRTWTNFLDGNAADPDDTATPGNVPGWAANDPIWTTVAPALGVYNDVVLLGPSDLAMDVNTTAGDVTYNGFIAQRSGQRLIISNTGPNLLILASLAGGSAPSNQIRTVPGGIIVPPGDTRVLQSIAGLNKWLFI